MKPEINRFVLADPSILSSKGHYLEYALRVLAAVERADGWTPALAVNRAFNPIALSRLDLPVEAAFTYDIWGRVPPTVGTESSSEGRSAYYRHLLGRVGLVWQLSEDLSNLRQYSVRAGMSPHQLRWIRKAAELRWHMARLPKRDEDESEDSLMSRVLAGERATETEGPDFSDLEAPSAVTQKSEVFRKELDGLISSMKLGPDDFLFLPTMGWHDLAGLTEWLKHAPKDKTPRFGLLFRRNIYGCYAHEFYQYGFEVHDLSAAFDRLRQADTDGLVTLFTDTDELTAEYDSISFRPFKTLPIPAPDLTKLDVPRRPKRERPPYSLVYLGDAREEKGFKFLPVLLNEAVSRARDDNTPALRLKSQCYFAPGFDDGEVIAAAAVVRSHAPEYCDIIDGVLEGDAYALAIHDADAILVPYNRENYISRSSGIFIEAVTAKKPVIVTAGTHMANVLDSETYAYHRKAVPQSAIIGELNAGAFHWETANPDIPVRFDEYNRPNFRPQQQAFAQISVPKAASHVWLHFEVPDVPSTFVQIAVTGLDANGQTTGMHERVVLGGGKAVRSVLLPVERGVATLRVSPTNPNTVKTFTMKDFTVNWLRLDKSVGRSIGGVTFVNDFLPEHRTESFLSAVHALERDFEAYESSLEKFGEKLRKFHNADSLVAEALAAAGLRSRGKAKTIPFARRGSA